MTYIFSGVFSAQETKSPRPEDSEELVVRKIAHPQLKSGALFAAQADAQIDRPNQVTHDLITELKKIGISDGLWVYYCCWGGEIDAVATASVNDSTIDMNSYSLVEDIDYGELSEILKSSMSSLKMVGILSPSFATIGANTGINFFLPAPEWNIPGISCALRR